MWCLKCSWKSRDCTIVLNWTRDIEVLKNGIFVIHGHKKLLHSSTMKADAMDAITLFESKDYSFFVFCGKLATFRKITDDEWKGRRMCEHIRDGRAICTEQGKTQICCGAKNDGSPSSANMGKRIPPVSIVFPTRDDIFVQKNWSKEIKHVEKGIIIEDVDRCSTSTVIVVTHKPIGITGERSLPLPLGLAAYFTLADSCSGLTTRGSRYARIHAVE